jgi:hypothetical protein
MAKLFIEGKKSAQRVDEEAHEILERMDHVTDGEMIVLHVDDVLYATRKDKITSVVGMVDARVPDGPVAYDASIFQGRGLKVRACRIEDVTKEGTGDLIDGILVPGPLFTNNCVVVECEDLASAVVFVYDAVERQRVWVNPANPDAATERYERIVIAAIEAETAVEQAYQEEFGDGEGRRVQALNLLNGGKIVEAVELMGQEWVEEQMQAGHGAPVPSESEA